MRTNPAVSTCGVMLVTFIVNFSVVKLHLFVTKTVLDASLRACHVLPHSFSISLSFISSSSFLFFTENDFEMDNEHQLQSQTQGGKKGG